MNMIFFDTPYMMFAGLMTGFVFGFLLQKGGVARFQGIVGQLLLKDFTVAKIMLTAMIVGGILLYSLLSFNVIPMFSLDVAPSLAIILLGGAIFGVGMAILGYCPGTCVAGAGQGAHDAWFGLLGMLAGGMVFALAYPLLATCGITGGTIAEPFVHNILGVSPWLVFGLLSIFAIVLFRFLAAKKL